jgi:hypothetical protein
MTQSTPTRLKGLIWDKHSSLLCQSVIDKDVFIAFDPVLLGRRITSTISFGRKTISTRL